MAYLAGSRVMPAISVPRRVMRRLEKKAKRFSRASARELDWRMMRMTLIEVVEGDLVAEQDVLAVASLARRKAGAAADDVDAVIEEGVDGLV